MVEGESPGLDGRTSQSLSQGKVKEWSVGVMLEEFAKNAIDAPG